MQPATSYWTEERITLLKEAWEAGRLSASEIAAELGGGVSRNAVIAKAHRLGLSGRHQGVKPGSVREPRPPRQPGNRMVRVPRAPSRLAVALDQATEIEAGTDLQLSAEIIPFTQRKTLVELTTETCHWPVGDPLQPDFHFCGGKTLSGVSYCAHHTRIAYQRSDARARRNPKPMNLRRGGGDAWR
ncbi:GcrA cell cycle regulator [Afipia sp. P52-10]|uniref:GcrA family cell cycle regulator n=1 Tax=Afipia sp. P52-10 TaxID=1429916 RepID=UPI0003DF1041|nr:GcrA family cell cycle regulator [Afipia sp. P52-10]ETR78886.1 GcrA cell cycle regulator [Afipia sp. P52-10]